MNNKFFLGLFGVIVFIISYGCSRGKDGQLFLGLTLHFLLCIGIVFQSFQTRLSIKEIISYSVVYLISAFMGVWVNSELDEMAGMLILFFPAFSILYFILAGAIRFFRAKA